MRHDEEILGLTGSKITALGGGTGGLTVRRAAADPAPLTGSGFGDAASNEDFDVDPSNPTHNGQAQYVNQSGNRWLTKSANGPHVWAIESSVNNAGPILYSRNDAGVAGAYDGSGEGTPPTGTITAN